MAGRDQGSLYYTARPNHSYFYDQITRSARDYSAFNPNHGRNHRFINRKWASTYHRQYAENTPSAYRCRRPRPMASRAHIINQQPPADFLDRMFASASASLTALCLGLRAVEGGYESLMIGNCRSGSGSSCCSLQLARKAAASQAAACMDWIQAMSSVNIETTRDEKGCFQTDYKGCAAAAAADHVCSNNHSCSTPSRGFSEADALDMRIRKAAGGGLSSLISRGCAISTVVEQVEQPFAASAPMACDLNSLDVQQTASPEQLAHDHPGIADHATLPIPISPRFQDSPQQTWKVRAHAGGLHVISPIVFTPAASPAHGAAAREPSISPVLSAADSTDDDDDDDDDDDAAKPATTNSLQKRPDLTKDSDFLFDADFEAFLP